jgi:hypothetical protein
MADARRPPRRSAYEGRSLRFDKHARQWTQFHVNALHEEPVYLKEKRERRGIRPQQQQPAPAPQREPDDRHAGIDVDHDYHHHHSVDHSTTQDYSFDDYDEFSQDVSQQETGADTPSTRSPECLPWLRAGAHSGHPPPTVAAATTAITARTPLPSSDFMHILQESIGRHYLATDAEFMMRQFDGRSLLAMAILAQELGRAYDGRVNQ